MTGKRDAREDEIDRLFQSPQEEFVANRNAIAATLRRAGNREAADRVKAIPKPSAAAAVVNRLYWSAREPFDALIRAGERWRAAQRAALAGKRSDVPEASKALREAMTPLLKEASRRGWMTPALQQRVTTSLEAMASYGGDHPEATPGRLVTDLEPPGFGALAALAPPGGVRAAPHREHGAIVKFPSKQPVRPTADHRTLTDARRIGSELEAQVSGERRQAERVEAAHEAAVRAVDRARAEVEAQEQALSVAREVLKRAEDQARVRRQEARDAAAAVKKAEAALDTARRRVAVLEARGGRREAGE